MSDAWSTSEEAAIARRLLRSTDAGVLATVSLDVAGYPFGSVTPYVMTHEGCPTIYVSTIAQHTKNMDADARVSLTVLDAGEGNRQALGRATVVGDARRLEGEELSRPLERYFALFPESREYAGTHGFSLYAIEPVRVRYIGGFGKIYWVERDDWRVPTPEWIEREGYVVAHMNDDHADALLAMARQVLGSECESAELVAVDAEGCHLRVDGGVLHLEFAAPAMSVEAVRAAMIELARGAS